MVIQVDEAKERIRNLYVFPNYAVLIPPPLRGSRSKTIKRIDNEKNLKQNRTNGFLSAKSRKRLVNAINWLVLASKKKRVYCNRSQRWHSFRLSFITLTVPVTNHGYSDEFFKKKVLHNFLSNAYAQFGLRNYVWKIERNKNGNIHFHLTTDKYIHYSAIRQMWNSALSKFGIIDFYADKFNSMGLDDYKELRISQGTEDEESILKAYNQGVAENWRNPNSTDVHSVRGIRDLSAYLADYMAKKEVGKQPIAGRQWGCSHSLSANVKNETEIILGYDDVFERDLFSSSIQSSPIEVKNEIGVVTRVVGVFFKWHISEVGRGFNGGVYQVIADMVARIRSPQRDLMLSV